MVHRYPYPRRPIRRFIYLAGMALVTALTGTVVIIAALLVGFAALFLFLSLYT